MGIFNILKNKNNNSNEKSDNALLVEPQDNSIIEISNYILVDAKKNKIALSNSIKMPISFLTSI